MCGITALFSKHGQISESSLSQGIKSLKHRGPDGQNFWISRKSRVGLGHARLSIIDLEGGEQPIANQDRTLHIVVNGEFYGYEQIQKDLKQQGYKLQTQSDSEIALHLYDKLGTKCLHDLRGEFAFVLWDERNQLMFAARDRFGIKPLYYTIYNDTLYLASEVKALFAAGVPAYWDREAFFNVDMGVNGPHRTLFANIYQVPPGYFLLASDGGIQLEKYWDFNYPQVDNYPSNISPQDYIDKLRYILDEAVRLRLRADVPVGCYLSGGLDSASILGMAASHVSEPIQAFTIAFQERAYNEEAIAREMAAHAGANLQVIPVHQSDLAEHFADAIFHCETLCINAHATAKYLLSRATQDAGYKVVLTGEGSDEIFGGYVHFRQDMLLHNTEGQDPDTIEELLKQLKDANKLSAGILVAEGNDASIFDSVKRTLGYIPAWIKALSTGHLQNPHIYSLEWIEQFGQRDVYRIFLNQINVQGQLAKREPVNQSLYLWTKTILANYILRLLGDGIEMAHSIEGRLPILDHKVVELVRNMPVSLKIKGLNEKYALREAARPFITNTIYNRQKHPFLSPPASLNPNEPLYQLTQDKLRSSTMASLPFYNQAAVIQLLDQLPAMSEQQSLRIDPVLMKMLSACVLQERFGLT